MLGFFFVKYFNIKFAIIKKTCTFVELKLAKQDPYGTA